MKHFYQKIEGWFSFPYLYSEVVQSLPHTSSIVEIGAWKGRSTAYLGVELFNSSKNITFYVVDTWDGSDEVAHKNDLEINNLYSVFLKNMQILDGLYHPLRNSSIIASELFQDKELDFIFIDASHKYEDVLADLKHWFPKLKDGGIIAGHDYTKNWPGVVKAVNEFFGDKVINLKSQSCWVYKNEKAEATIKTF